MRTLSNVQVSRCARSEQLLSILQALLLVDPGSSRLWAALEQLAEQAVLLSHDCKSDLSFKPFFCQMK